MPLGDPYRYLPKPGQETREAARALLRTLPAHWEAKDVAHLNQKEVTLLVMHLRFSVGVTGQDSRRVNQVWQKMELLRDHPYRLRPA